MYASCVRILYVGNVHIARICVQLSIDVNRCKCGDWRLSTFDVIAEHKITAIAKSTSISEKVANKCMRARTLSYHWNDRKNIITSKKIAKNHFETQMIRECELTCSWINIQTIITHNWRTLHQWQLCVVVVDLQQFQFSTYWIAALTMTIIGYRNSIVRDDGSTEPSMCVYLENTLAGKRCHSAINRTKKTKQNK